MNQGRAQKIIIAVLALLLVVVSATLITKTFYSPSTTQPQDNDNLNVNEYSNPNPDNTPEPVAKHDLTVKPFSTEYKLALDINWIIPGMETSAKSVAAEIGQKIPAPKKDSDGILTSEPAFTKVGTIKSAGSDASSYIGDNLYRVTAGCEMGTNNCIDFLGIADPKQKKFVALARYPLSDEWIHPNNEESAVIDYPLTNITFRDKNLKILDLEPPSYLQLTKFGYFLETNLKGTGTPDSTAYDQISTSADGTILYADHNGISGRLPNGELVQYSLGIPFFADQRIPAITWNDGTINKSDYAPIRVGGCGGGPGLALNIVNEKDFTEPLILGGKTINGEDIYVPKDPNGKLLTDLYNFSTDSANGTIYQDFVARRPVFFWRDPFNRLIRWERADVVPLAECGKPVVYLYPTQTEQVSVKLGSNIEVTKSEPTYQNGWKVTAEPNGTLTTTDGKTFPYLYWDGNGASYQTPTTGFVVASKDIEATLSSKLATLGLNEKEIADFNEFWVPIVSRSPYALISFVPQDEWSKAAPLAISPTPDTVIRVFMDWKPLSAPIEVVPQVLPPTPVRTGFTAVEWGGLLYK